jgi:hypothetical protein
MTEATTAIPPWFIELSQELESAVKGVSKEEWRVILTTSSQKAAKITASSKIESIKNLAQVIKRKASQYSRDPKVAFQSDCSCLKKTVVTFPKNAYTQFQRFFALSKQDQYESMAATLLSILLFFSVMGGFDAEGGLPDMDTKLFGIGDHRNIISHSIILGFGTEFALRFAIYFVSEIHARLPEHHHKIWDTIARVANKAENQAVSAVWLGIGVHLAKDAGVFSSRIKPVVGIPGEHSMLFHKTFLETNSALSVTFGMPVQKAGQA